MAKIKIKRYIKCEFNNGIREMAFNLFLEAFFVSIYHSSKSVLYSDERWIDISTTDDAVCDTPYW